MSLDAAPYQWVTAEKYLHNDEWEEIASGRLFLNPSTNHLKIEQNGNVTLNVILHNWIEGFREWKGTKKMYCFLTVSGLSDEPVILRIAPESQRFFVDLKELLAKATPSK